jgi:hypothetical protein
MTASGAKIATTLAWLAQNAAIAGVAVFAIAVSRSTTVGRYATYFFKIVSPCNSVPLMSIGSMVKPVKP